MADSPEKYSDGVLTSSITSNGRALKDTVQIISVHVHKAVNHVSFARIVIQDGDMPDMDFPASNTDDLMPGARIEISAGYDAREQSIFKGVVVRHGIKISGQNNARLVIECWDKAVGMTVGRKNAHFTDIKDSELISKLIQGYSSLKADIGNTTNQYRELVQYYCTDWDYMLTRAEANGMVVLNDAGIVSVKAPDVTGSAVLNVTYGQDLMEFNADMDACHQYAGVSGYSWDPEAQAVLEQSGTAPAMNKQGNLDSSKLAEVLGLDSFHLQSPVNLDKSMLKSWAEGQQLKSGLARIQGRMKFQGSAKALPGTLITINNVGEQFNGNVFVSAVTHDLEEGNWVTEAEFGLRADWFADKRDLVSAPASGLVPGIEGLQIGVVKELEGDPDKLYRVKVTVPMLDTDTEGVWARLANMHASDEFGCFFLPEIGDEVVLGFFNNDPSHPVILGSMQNGKLAPPYDMQDTNNVKAILTRSKLLLEFNEEDKVITLKTLAGNVIELNEKEECISLEDQNNNKILMSETGISLTSPKDITLNADGKISMKAQQNIEMEATADLTAKGKNVSCTAKIGFTAKGNASAELSASGQTTVKGAMVMIN